MDGAEPTSEAAKQPPVPQQGLVSTAPLGVVSTSTPTIETGSTTGVAGAGLVALTNTSPSGLPASTMSLQQNTFAGLLQSALLSDPLQVAALQQKLASLALGGGLTVPLPPGNVTQVPLFKTATDSAMFEMNTLLQNLPQLSTAPGGIANMDGMFAIMRQIAGEHRVLMVNKRERDIEAKLKDVTNPMSRRAIEHNLRLLECVTNIKKCLTINGNVLVASTFNLEMVNRAIVLVISSVQEIEDRVKSDHSKHLVAQKSVFGWRFVSGLEDLEKKCGHIDMVTLRSQEKAFAAHQAAVGGTSKWSDSDFLGESG